eukprot:TRINITY_DN25857_c0_g1_i1.p1 TRINITY_DN25857_c0_g1~~TRINITY_DN25857_c0_g1_i1.p1  ORF type:complete len:838 (+),score=199.89 TRINITY_DN25857_c0_g1_i1:191-2704(+)
MGKKDESKVPKRPLLPPEVPEEDIEVSDEDIEFVRKHKRYAGFLKRLDTKTITKHVIGLQDDADEELEAYYEKRVQKSRLEEEEKEKNRGLSVDPASVLPVKTLSGELHFQTDTKVKDSLNQNNEAAVNKRDAKEDKGSNNKANLTKAERRRELKKEKRKAKKQEKEGRPAKPSDDTKTGVLEELKKDLSLEELFAERKAHIAEIGTALLTDPEQNISKLKELVGLCNDEDDRIASLALLSLAAIFKDIVPGYRIRLPTEKEMQTKVSKEVKKLRDYEAALLKYYQKYLQSLIVLSKGSDIMQLAVRCLCILLEANPHFNYRESLLSAVVPQMNSIDDTNRKLSCAAVRSLFLNEGKHRGEATVEAVKLIAKLVKQTKCCLHPDVIEVFLSLSFDEDLGQKKDLNSDVKKNQQEKSNVRTKSENKAKKQLLAAKLRDEVEADLKAAFSIVDPSKRREMQTKTLAAVFEIYFRILKAALEPQQERLNAHSNDESLNAELGCHPLLVSCLDGIGKFSHLINVDFMGDLFALLRKLAAGYNVDRKSGAAFSLNLTVPERLRCCVVAFKILRSNLDALNIDLREFYVELYNLLLECQPEREDQGQPLAEALQIMLCEGRQHDMQRVAAFVKRLSSLSLHYASAEAITVLITIKNLLQKYSKCRNLLENDGGGGSVGGTVAIYQPKASDPEMSGALSSVLWELSLLANHYHPAVSELCNNIATMGIHRNQVFLSNLSAPGALKTYSTNGGLFNPPFQMPKPSNKRKIHQVHSCLTNSLYDGIKEVIKKDNITEKFVRHFKLLRAIKANENLRKEYNRNLSALRLYDKYRKQSERAKKKAKVV